MIFFLGCSTCHSVDFTSTLPRDQDDRAENDVSSSRDRRALLQSHNASESVELHAGSKFQRFYHGAFLEAVAERFRLFPRVISRLFVFLIMKLALRDLNYEMSLSI